MKSALKAAARAAATLVVLPALLSFAVRRRFLGRDRAVQGSSQALALVPGLLGHYVRRAFFRWTLAGCHPTATVEFGTIFSQAGARLDEHVYVGPHCSLGLVHVERDTLIAAGVHVPSGAHTHGTAALGVPMREQPGTPRRVRIGAGSWIGSAAVVMADVGEGVIVGAGAVVTRPTGDYVIVAGVPARVIGRRIELAAAH
jgi:virginiamycin A acetyltransferase